MDADTREWTDGVLTAAARAVAKERLDKQSWIVCDGDVDPEWIESLNSVLDDNRQTVLLAFWQHCLPATQLAIHRNGAVRAAYACKSCDATVGMALNR